jgi:outer membrane protein TolC
MRFIGGLAIVVLGTTIVRGDPAPAAPGANGLKLEDAVHLALTRNERTVIADLNVKIVEAGVSKARAAFLPILSADGNNTLKPFDKSPVDVATARLTVSQPVLVPSAFPLYSEAKENLASQVAQTIEDKRQLTFDAAKAFFNVLLAEKVLEAAHRKLDTAKADLLDTTAQMQAQLVSSNDVTRAQISLSGSVREVAADQGALDAAYLQLAFVVNTPVSPGLTAPTALLEASERPLPPIDKLVAASLAHRPDLVARKHAAIAAHDFAREPHMRFYPTVGVSAQGTATTNAGTGHDIDAQLAITASWEIWDAGVRDADARSRDASASIADLTRNTLERSIEVQVRTAVVQLASAQQALAAARDAQVASAKSADETAILYHQGLAKAIELLDANDQRFVADVNFAAAQDTVATAYLALRQAMGLDPIGTELS